MLQVHQEVVINSLANSICTMYCCNPTLKPYRQYTQCNSTTTHRSPLVSWTLVLQHWTSTMGLATIFWYYLIMQVLIGLKISSIRWSAWQWKKLQWFFGIQCHHFLDYWLVNTLIAMFIRTKPCTKIFAHMYITWNRLYPSAEQSRTFIMKSYLYNQYEVLQHNYVTSSTNSH